MPADAIYHVLGLMSGSSLDGMDIVYTEITAGDHYTFKIIEAETFPYSAEIKNFLSQISPDPKADISDADFRFAVLSAGYLNEFITKHHIDHIDFIASHGHTIFHYPEKNITCQIGNGKKIAEATGYPTISNFRQKDLDAGGQGAPLVPLCDELFFSSYDSCLNIGGIANISFKKNGVRTGFDICAANQLLNFCAAEAGLAYDAGGELAEQGSVDQVLISKLNGRAFFHINPPKSLDNNRIKTEMIVLFELSHLRVEDKLATATEHIAYQVAAIVKSHLKDEQIPAEKYQMLVTGGGAYNQFLINRIEKLSGIHIQLPSTQVIEFKEALAMCLMGVLRWNDQPNFLPSVTGAAHAVSGGDIYLNKQ